MTLEHQEPVPTENGQAPQHCLKQIEAVRDLGPQN